MYMKCFFKDWT